MQWCPTSEKFGLIRTLENVQRSFTPGISGITELNYSEKLKVLKLSSLETRRERYCYINLWKVLHKLVPNFDNGAMQEYMDGRSGLLCRGPS